MITKEKYLQHDDSTVSLTTHDELTEYLQYRKEHDVWIEPFINEMAVDMVDRMKAEYPNGGTAIDVYLAVCELYRDYCAGNSVSLNKRITLSESVARMMKLPFDKIDAEAMNEAW